MPESVLEGRNWMLMVGHFSMPIDTFQAVGIVIKIYPKIVCFIV